MSLKDLYTTLEALENEADYVVVMVRLLEGLALFDNQKINRKYGSCN